MKVLGIETSCDETAVSIVEDNKIISEIISSQIDIHSEYGGVVPEIASREHLKKLNLILETCLANANLSFEDIEAVAVTSAPGLEGSLLVGRMVARTISFLIKIPLIEINHLEAHLFASAFTPPLGGGAGFTDLGNSRGIGLIVSGGHTRVVHVKNWGEYEILGNTRDDAVGECFDKVASILGLAYPGGPAIEKTANDGNPLEYKFPVSNLGDSYDFSYSGIKTAVLYKVKYDFNGSVNEKQKKDIAASFQRAAFRPLVNNSIKAAREFKANWLFVCGGVAANKELRKILQEKAAEEEFKIVFPAPLLCTDNASMVAVCGQFYLKNRLKAESHSQSGSPA